MKTKFDAKTKEQVRALLREYGLEFLSSKSWVTPPDGFQIIKSANNSLNAGRTPENTLALAIQRAMGDA